jgi:type VI protein secretion system component VasF
MDEKKFKMRRMAAWTIAVFATIFASVMTVLWTTLFKTGTPAFAATGEAFISSWPVLLIDLVLCVAVYSGYSLFLNRQK